MEKQPIVDTLAELRNQPTSGLTRTHGSMFFLELGQLALRNGAKRTHGEWHFLFELCHWRISSISAVLIGSDDDPSLIDIVFSEASLGRVEEATVEALTGDLFISFSSGNVLRTLTTSAKATDEDWIQWRLYCPDEKVWVADGAGRLAFRNIHESRI